jgi:twinkle protein
MIKPEDFANKHFREYKIKGDEIIPLYCPYCEGGSKRDQNTSAMNIDTGAFNCKRGSCSQAVSFTQLCRDFGEATKDIGKNFEIGQRKKKVYVAPTTEITPAQAKVENYLKQRGISKTTWESRKVGESQGNIVFPYYESGQLVLVKFRKPEKYTGEGQKAWREKGGKAVFWGMDDCDHKLPLVITEGEFDALVLSEAGVKNVVSVPSGSEDLECVTNCWDWLQGFNKVIIWPDNDEPGQKMARELISKLSPWRCWIVKVEHKDANEMLFKAGKEAVREAVENAQEVPIVGLVRLADVQAFNVEGMVRIPSTASIINKEVGGYALGFLSVWTGESGSGKSTFLGQEMLKAVQEGFNACVYSGELPGALFRYWIDLQAVGPDPQLWVKYHDPIKQKDLHKPTKTAIEGVHRWYYDKFFLCDSFGTINDEDLLELFDYAYKRYNCRVFLADNLMTMNFTGDDRDYYRKQGRMVGKLKDFAYNKNVHVHLVAHPRKNDGRLTKDDVAGSKEITNRPDNVFGIYRCKEGDESKYDGFLDIFKNRWSGQERKDAGLKYDPMTKRMYQPSDGGDWDLGW